MKVSTEKIQGSQVVLTIETDKEEMDKSLEKAYHRLAAKTAVPGFRKGKATRPMLERYLGREALVEEAANLLMVESYDKAIEEHKVDVITRPQVEVIQLEPLSFKATVSVRPTMELGDYHEIKFVPETVVVTDEEIDETLERLRNMRATWEPVEREAQPDDLLSINLEGTVDGESVLSEKGGWYPLSLGPSTALPGFSEQLVGSKKGEEKTFVLKLSQDFEEHAGQDCSFKVLVNEIKQKNLPNLDNEFAKSLGGGIETIDALREKVIADIKSEKERVERRKLEDKAIEALVAGSRLEYPDILVQDEIDHLMDERKQSLGERDSLENYLKDAKKTEEEFRNELKPKAEDILKRSLVMAKLGEVEKIEVSDVEIDAEVERLIQGSNNNEKVKEKVRQLFNSPSGRETLRRNIYIRKTIDRLAEITITGEGTAPLEEKEGGKENGEPTK